MKKRTYLNPMETEEILGKARKDAEISEVTEREVVKGWLNQAKLSGKFGDKILLCVNPIYIHIPTWQRKLYIPKAESIGNHYNPHKWDTPKVLFINGKLYVIEGQHRIYGAFLGKKDNVVVEVLTGVSEAEAIEIFLDQGKDRRGISPQDKYGAAIEAGKPEYLELKRICEKNKVRVKGDLNSIKNPVGIFSSISDGVGMAKSNPELLDRILMMIGKLQWNVSTDESDGKAYSAKVIRVFKKLYAYYSGNEKTMENILLTNCKGGEYFNNNLAKRGQDVMFDYLANIIEQNINIAVIPQNVETRNRRMAKAN